MCGAARSAAGDGPAGATRGVGAVRRLVGFTARSERIDVDDVRDVLEPFHRVLRRELERHGGTLEKFIGDAVMAIFGAPVAHEDDAQPAVRAGLAIHGVVARLNQRGTAQISRPVLESSGLGIDRFSANPLAGEGMASADVVNTAARLQAAAPVNGVLVGQTTYRATDRTIRYEATAPVVAKGKSDPVPVWLAIQHDRRYPSSSEATTSGSSGETTSSANSWRYSTAQRTSLRRSW